MTETRTWQEGDVIRWMPENRHCREGCAIFEDGRFLDTFWGSSRHRLRPAEVETGEFLFSCREFERFAGPFEDWVAYPEEDRGRITHQHGHIAPSLFVRPGAKPDLSLQIEQAHNDREEAISNLRSAERSVQICDERLQKLMKSLPV